MIAGGEARLDGDVAGGIAVMGRAEALEAILEAVVDNALSFSSPGQRVEVRLEQIGEDVTLSVADCGPGVAEDRLERIFDRYHSHRPGAVAGHHFGIGLWLARQNAHSLGGTIRAANRSPHGLRVTITLPSAAPD
jgi:two-component system sensor histidine kinase ChvG